MPPPRVATVATQLARPGRAYKDGTHFPKKTHTHTVVHFARHKDGSFLGFYKDLCEKLGIVFGPKLNFKPLGTMSQEPFHKHGRFGGKDTNLPLIKVYKSSDLHIIQSGHKILALRIIYISSSIPRAQKRNTLIKCLYESNEVENARLPYKPAPQEPSRK